MEKYEKQCHKCKRVLPASMFYKRNESADGLQEWCKDCKAESAKRNYKRNQALKNKIKNDLEIKIKNKLEGQLRAELKKEVRSEMRAELRIKRGRKPSSFFGKMFKFFSKKRNSTFKIPLNNVVSIEHKKDKLVVVYKK